MLIFWSRGGPKDGRKDGPGDGRKDGPRDGHNDGTKDGRQEIFPEVWWDLARFGLESSCEGQDANDQTNDNEGLEGGGGWLARHHTIKKRGGGGV